jgi:hypothetical protein
MISFNQPTQLNGLQLVDELAQENIIVTGFPLIDANGILWLDIKTNDKNKCATIVQNHKGQNNYQDAKAIARTALLQRLGITEAEAELLK